MPAVHRRLLAGIAGLVVATAAGALSATAAPSQPVDRYIVAFADSSAASLSAGGVNALAADIAARHRGTVLHTFTAALRGATIELTPAAARALAADPRVAAVERDQPVRLLGTATPDSALDGGVQENAPWNLDRIDQRTPPLDGKYHYLNTAPNVNIYIIDTGIRKTHVEFAGRARDGYDFVDNDPVADDCNGHGTHVAGVAGAATWGVAKEVTLYGVKVLGCNGSGTISGVIAGVEWVTVNAQRPAVANMSIGGTASTMLDTAVRNSILSGVTYTVAAGSSNGDACQFSPARVAEAITVAGLDESDTRVSSSNYGTCIDIFAPGRNIQSTWITNDTATLTISGTSAAAPHAAGAAAILLSPRPDATPAQVKSALLACATTGLVINPGAGSPNRILYTLCQIS